MDSFTIKDIENLSGIKAHTLRMWEKRYQLHTPKRRGGNHRIYDNEDLKFYIKVAFLNKSGYKISGIAAMTREEMDAKSIVVNGTAERQLVFISGLITAAIEFDETGFRSLLERAIEQFGFEITVRKVIYPFFERIGLLWMTNNARPSQEHFSSNIIRNLLIRAIDQLGHQPVKEGAPLILFTPEEEYHEIPLLYAWYMLKKHHKQVIYAGVGISLNELKYICNEIPAANVYFHLITNLTKLSVNEYITELRKQLPHQKIIMSGPLAKQATLPQKDCLFIHSMDCLYRFINEY